ncbi:hypothetical protein MKW98_004949 [Papaver atlanticum]|uniref:Uncharacterized protein n=1 Tax=Papaver atlanticum TaxID=357466 RepID=A0AAD4SI44_9MAGN|nr:hypothetical protein MKW98_004949 [Papaver atlanticum]
MKTTEFTCNTPKRVHCANSIAVVISFSPDYAIKRPGQRGLCHQSSTSPGALNYFYEDESQTYKEQDPEEATSEHLIAFKRIQLIFMIQLWRNQDQHQIFGHSPKIKVHNYN